MSIVYFRKRKSLSGKFNVEIPKLISFHINKMKNEPVVRVRLQQNKTFFLSWKFSEKEDISYKSTVLETAASDYQLYDGLRRVSGLRRDLAVSAE